MECLLGKECVLEEGIELEEEEYQGKERWMYLKHYNADIVNGSWKMGTNAKIKGSMKD